MSGHDDRSERQKARAQQRRQGDRSAQLAATLMKLTDVAFARIKFDDEVREAVARARAVTSQQARRRAERALAGDLRRFDLAEVAELIANAEANRVDVRQFQLVERWRARLIDEGDAAIAEFPAEVDDDLRRKIAAAKSERATGRPPGAARALFRRVAELLEPQDPDAA